MSRRRRHIKHGPEDMEGYIHADGKVLLFQEQLKAIVGHWSGHISLPEIAAVMAFTSGAISVLDENNVDFKEILEKNFADGVVLGIKLVGGNPQ